VVHGLHRFYILGLKTEHFTRSGSSFPPAVSASHLPIWFAFQLPIRTRLHSEKRINPAFSPPSIDDGTVFTVLYATHANILTLDFDWEDLVDPLFVYKTLYYRVFSTLTASVPTFSSFYLRRQGSLLVRFYAFFTR